jgi:hypothetical protein
LTAYFPRDKYECTCCSVGGLVEFSSTIFTKAESTEFTSPWTFRSIFSDWKKGKSVNNFWSTSDSVNAKTLKILVTVHNLWAAFALFWSRRHATASFSYNFKIRNARDFRYKSFDLGKGGHAVHLLLYLSMSRTAATKTEFPTTIPTIVSMDKFGEVVDPDATAATAPPALEVVVVAFEADVGISCIIRVPPGNPFWIKLVFSADWSLMDVCCPAGIRIEVCTRTEVARSNLPETLLEDLEETSSMLRIFTFSGLTPAVLATLKVYNAWFVMNADLLIGNETMMIMVSDCRQESERLFPWVTETQGLNEYKERVKESRIWDTKKLDEEFIMPRRIFHILVSIPDVKPLGQESQLVMPATPKL